MESHQMPIFRRRNFIVTESEVLINSANWMRIGKNLEAQKNDNENTTVIFIWRDNPGYFSATPI